MSRSTRAAVIAAGALVIAALGAGAGAGIYASLSPKTKTVVESTTVQQSPAAAPTSVSGSGSGMSVNAVYRRTYQGVVDITTTASTGFNPFGGSQEEQAEGSGFVYDKRGDVITNDHVISGATSVKVKFWNGKVYSGRVLGTDVSTDLAVVRVSAPSSLFHPLTLGDSNGAQVGEPVIAIGSPFGLPGTVTSGIVSAVDRTIQSPTSNDRQNGWTIGGAIQTDAAINHGNSGGPLIDAASHVLGVNAQIQSDGGGSNGVGFAIPSNTVHEVALQLIAGKSVRHSFLGIEMSESTSPVGIQVTHVVGGAAAAKAGLEQGDVIVSMDGKAVASSDDLSSVIDTHEPGDRITLVYVRNGQRHTVQITLGVRPTSS